MATLEPKDNVAKPQAPGFRDCLRGSNGSKADFSLNSRTSRPPETATDPETPIVAISRGRLVLRLTLKSALDPLDIRRQSLNPGACGLATLSLGSKVAILNLFFSYLLRCVDLRVADIPTKAFFFVGFFFHLNSWVAIGHLSLFDVMVTN